MNIDNIILEHGDFKTNLDSITAKGVEYLLRNGFKQSMVDCVAGLAKDVRENEADYRKELEADASISLDDLISEVLDARMRQRFDDIVKGEVGVRSGAPRATPLEKMVAEVAWERIKAAAIATKMKLPTEAGAKAQLVKGYLDSNAEAKAEITAEAEARLEKAKSDASSVNLAALMAALPKTEAKAD